MEYTSTIAYNIHDSLSHEVVDINPELLHSPDLTHFTITVIPNTDSMLLVKSIFESPLKVNRSEYIALDQEAKSPGSSPKAISLLSIRINEYKQLLTKVVDYLTWRKKLYVDHNSLKTFKTECICTLNGVPIQIEAENKWYAAGEPIEVETPVVTINSNDFEDFGFFYAERQKSSKPLHHELFVESERLLQIRQLRSCYLILYSSMEVASKTLIAHLAPATEWLINNIPSPDLVKLYREYVNKFDKIFLSDQELETVRNMANARNSAAHAGKEPRLESIIDHSKFVRKLLYRIDERIGFNWVNDEQDSVYY